MADGLHLSSRHREEIEALLHKHLPGVEVWAYGSRVNGRSHDGSDLDLVLRGPKLAKIDTSRLADFIEALQDSTIPFLVEARDWARLPETFHREIKRAHVVLAEEEELGTAGEWRETIYGRFASDFVEDCLVNLCNQINGVQTGPFGSQLHKKDYVSVGTPIITVEHLGNNRILHEDVPHVSDHDRERLSKYILHDGDIVFSRVGSVDRRALVKEAESGWLFSGRCLRVRPDPNKIDSGYLSYFFGLPSFKEHIRAIAVGATMPSLNTQILSDIVVPNPRGLNEQRAIAHILGTLDDKIELNRRMNETLEAMARALFKSWFVDFDPVRAKMEGRDTGLPKHLADLFPDVLDDDGKPFGWRVGELQELVELNPKEPLTKGTKAPYLGMSAVPTSGLTPELPIDREFKSGTRFRNGDTLLARITPCLENGKTAFIQILPPNTIGWGSTEFIVMRPFGPVPKPYAYILAREPDFRSHAIQSMTGTSGRQRARSDALAEYPVSIPNEDTWEAFASIVEPIFERIGANGWETQTLELTRDLLLPKLVSGRIRPRKTERAV